MIDVVVFIAFSVIAAVILSYLFGFKKQSALEPVSLPKTVTAVVKKDIKPKKKEKKEIQSKVIKESLTEPSVAPPTPMIETKKDEKITTAAVKKPTEKKLLSEKKQSIEKAEKKDDKKSKKEEKKMIAKSEPTEAKPVMASSVASAEDVGIWVKVEDKKQKKVQQKKSEAVVAVKPVETVPVEVKKVDPVVVVENKVIEVVSQKVAEIKKAPTAAQPSPKMERKKKDEKKITTGAFEKIEVKNVTESLLREAAELNDDDDEWITPKQKQKKEKKIVSTTAEVSK